MSITGLDTFDKTVHETNSWLALLADHLGFAERERA